MAGFEVPIHKSLIDPILIGGSPRTMAILNFTVCGSLGMHLRSWISVLLCIGIHILSVYLTKYDPYWMDVLRRHLRLPKIYHV